MESLSLETGPSHARTEWEAAAAAVLRKSGRFTDDTPDAEVWAALTRSTLDGIEVSPLGTPALTGSLATAGRPTRTGAWEVCAYFSGSDAATIAEDVLTDLENGVTAVWATLAPDQVATALRHVLLDAAPVILDAAADPLEVARAFAGLAQGESLAPGTTLGIDPIGVAVRSAGSLVESVESVEAQAADLAGELGCGALVADGTVVHDLGASDVQELGYALAVATTYLRRLTDAGRSVEDAAALISFRMAATDEQFPTIAKLRALRRLWGQVLRHSGLDAPTASRIHAVTSRPMMSKYDPWVNMLRTCVAAFAAGVGGADMVTVLPFDDPLGAPDAFSRRIARNTSSLLIEESHVAVVSDPAGGSHVVERLTDDTALAAWEEFGRIEADGFPGLADRIGQVVAERDRQVANRSHPITGLSEFPNLHEALPERTPSPTPSVRRYGHPFEALRDEPVGRPVFLATMGTVAAHTARATFATNLFAAGGIDVVNEGAHEDADAVLAHYRGESVVCLVGSDTAYSEWGTGLADRLREAGAARVIVAGKPLDGCDDNCASGVDALDFLTRTREQLV